jgi:hypothetical protein
MTDDLVKRLRKNVMCGDAVIEEAADRIEKLEAALREVLSLGTWGANILARCIMFEALETTNGSLGEKG